MEYLNDSREEWLNECRKEPLNELWEKLTNECRKEISKVSREESLKEYLNTCWMESLKPGKSRWTNPNEYILYFFAKLSQFWTYWLYFQYTYSTNRACICSKFYKNRFNIVWVIAKIRPAQKKDRLFQRNALWNLGNNPWTNLEAILGATPIGIPECFNNEGIPDGLPENIPEGIPWKNSGKSNGVAWGYDPERIPRKSRKESWKKSVKKYR